MNEKDVINKYLDQIISVLDNKASQLHKILHEASDIDDFEKSQHIWFGVRQKLEKIKQLKNNIIDMKAHELLSEIFDEETELSVVHNTVNTAVALEDKSNDSDTDIDNSQNNTEIKDEQLGAEYSSTCELNTDNVNESWMSLTDDLTWGKVKKLYFDHKKYLVKDFTEAFVKLHELLYDRDREKFLEMMNEKFVNTDKKKHISTNDRFKYPGDEHNYYKKMNNTNIYVWVNKSNSNKARFIIKMLNYFDIPCDSVKLLVENIDTNNKSNNVDIFSTFDENEAENEMCSSPRKKAFPETL